MDASSSQVFPYNPKDAASIITYAQMLIGSTLREHVDIDSIDDPHRRKGSFGNAVEKYYFLFDINSDSNPDFADVGLELKTTPLKKDNRGRYSSKERLVISMINYMTIVDESWETSSLLHKASDILLISYLYDKETDPLDYLIELVTRWGLPEEDLPIFKQDWETIVGKVRAGLAHEISGSDTLYLEACTKSSDSSKRRKQPYSPILAKPRAWALKASYMTTVSNGLLKAQAIARSADEQEMGLFDLVQARFRPYVGMTENELAARFGYSTTKKSKALCALITKQILGVKKESRIAEFEKAGIKPKTMRITHTGRSKESVSFPAFDYFDLVKTPFDESTFKTYLETKYLFVIFREDPQEAEVYRLSEVLLWQMPDDDLLEAQRCYEQMQNNVKMGHAEVSVKSTENHCCHVRPHGRNSEDTCMTPYGVAVPKKCFWLNARYLTGEIAKSTKENE